MHLFLRDGMCEIQLPRMERLSLDVAVVWVIQKISNQRMPDVLHMHANLMCAPGFKLELYERNLEVASVVQTPKMRDCGFSVQRVHTALDGRAVHTRNFFVDGSTFGYLSLTDGKIGAS